MIDQSLATTTSLRDTVVGCVALLRNYRNAWSQGRSVCDRVKQVGPQHGQGHPSHQPVDPAYSIQ